jgi:hypothetical protein
LVFDLSNSFEFFSVLLYSTYTMGSVFSYIVSIAVTFIISKIGSKLVWANKKVDGTPKSPWAPSPSNLPYFTKGYSEYNQDGYRALTRWSKLLGDLYSVELGYKRVNVINSAELVHKILVEKEQLNSSRLPSDTMEQILTDQCKTIYTSPFSLYWARLRRAVYIVIGQLYIGQFSRFFKDQAKNLSFGISESLREDGTLSTQQLRQLVDMVAMDSALAMVLGSQKDGVTRDPAAMLTLIQKCHELEKRQTRKYNRMGQFFPFINSCLDLWSLFTLNSTNMTLRNSILEIILPWFEPIYQLRGDVPLSEAEKKSLHAGGKVSSIAKSLLNVEPSKHDPEPEQLTKDEILVNSVHIILHAYTYLSSTLFTLIQRLATEPEWQTRLKQETTSEDKSLAHAFVKESLRYDPPNHVLAYGPRTDYDLEVNNKLYRVDMDSEIIVNVDAIHNNSRYYPEPTKFDPERFLKSDQESAPLLQLTDKKTANDHLAFGAGRRVCLGSKASEDLLVATLIQLVKTYELKGGNVTDKIESTTSVWSWVGRTETKGSLIEFIKRS